MDRRYAGEERIDILKSEHRLKMVNNNIDRFFFRDNSRIFGTYRMVDEGRGRVTRSLKITERSL